MKYVLSYGGGVNSSALFFYITEKKMPLDIVIFADTGEESKETYDAVERMKVICKKQNIPLIPWKSLWLLLFKESSNEFDEKGLH